MSTHIQWERMRDFIETRTGVKFNTRSGGIDYRKNGNVAILKSVEGTFYYHDNLSNPNLVHYTLAGKIGDQTETRRNKSVLRPGTNIYLFEQNNRGYGWYGKYIIVDKYVTRHIGENRIMRNIIIVVLKRIEE
jgi:hypothetical protein